MSATQPKYLEIVQNLRQAFPTPISDRMHDAYFVFSFLRALDQVDGLKLQAPMLGEPGELDYAAARTRTVDEQPRSVEPVVAELVAHLSGMFIFGHPRSQMNVVPSPTIPSIIGSLLPSIYNPNLVSDESSRRVALAEVEVASMAARLVGYDATRSAGVFTFGGTGTTLYGVKIGLEKALPGTLQRGVQQRAIVLCSAQAHYAAKTVAGWLGLGQDQVVLVPTDEQNEIRPCLLHTLAREELRGGNRIAAIIGTMGTTDAFGVDDLAAVCQVRDELVAELSLDYIPHVHADAVIGWAWSVFNDYDFSGNPLGFRGRTLRALAGVRRKMQHLGMADSIGIDFHKTGFAPYVSSLLLVREQGELERLARSPEAMPYLFQSGHYHPGRYTLETTRSGCGPLAALANLLLFGKQGLRALLGHLVTMAETLREQLESHAGTHVMNSGNFGTVTVFRVYPPGVDTFTVPHRERTDPAFRESLRKYNDYNRRLYELLQAEALQGRGVVLSLTDCYRETDYGEPMVALKSVIMSPFTEPDFVEGVMDELAGAQRRLAERDAAWG